MNSTGQRWLAFPFSYSFSLSGGMPINLTEEFLKFLPADTKLVYAYNDNARGLFALVFASDRFDLVPVGSTIPEGTIEVKRGPNGDFVSNVFDQFGNSFSANTKSSIQTHILRGSLGKNCAHDWQIYHGLLDSTEICKHCGLERKP